MKANELINLLNNLNTVKVLVIGDVMLDDYTFCENSKSKPIPSEHPSKKAFLTVERNIAPGGAANVAVNLRSMGVTTSLLGVVGRDGYEVTIRRELEQLGVTTCLVSEKDRPTTTKRRIYIDKEYFFRIDNEVTSPIEEESQATLLRELDERVPEVDIICISDYNKGVFKNSNLGLEIIKLAKKYHVPVIVDCKPSNISCFENASIIIPNLAEAKELLPSFDHLNSLKTSVNKIFELVKSESVAVTMGAYGICGFDGKSFSFIPALKVNLLDSVGAGDTVRAFVAIGTALNLSFQDTLKLANIAGAISVSKLGTSSVTIPELASSLRDYFD
jgi:D-glycero-beta-D-manno-heptose-7-phosphate kinase